MFHVATIARTFYIRLRNFRDQPLSQSGCIKFILSRRSGKDFFRFRHFRASWLHSSICTNDVWLLPQKTLHFGSEKQGTFEPPEIDFDIAELSRLFCDKSLANTIA
jgi:hypothetical protein